MSLTGLQVWFQERVTHPAGVDPSDAALHVLPSATLSAAERIAIYNRSYHARLLDGFRSFFPALLHALGDQVFTRFALGYLQAHPSSSFTIARVADSFPAWMAATRPPEEAWPDFLIELATFEIAWREAFEGQSPEARRFAFRYPVHEYHAAVRRGRKPKVPDGRACVVEVKRRRFRVVVTVIR